MYAEVLSYQWPNLEHSGASSFSKSKPPNGHHIKGWWTSSQTSLCFYTQLLWTGVPHLKLLVEAFACIVSQSSHESVILYITGTGTSSNKSNGQRARRNFNSNQVELLQQAFQVNPYPARKDMDALSARLGISYKNCKVGHLNAVSFSLGHTT